MSHTNTGMYEVEYCVRETLAPYVNCIMIGESHEPERELKIPIYADGYPGIMFQESENDFFLFPKGKKLSQLFLYGQTIDPISLETKGRHRYVVVQLYPFVSKYLLGIDPHLLNDECYDLLQLQNVDIQSFQLRLLATRDFSEQIEVISDLMETLILYHDLPTEDQIQRAIAMILESDGKIKMKDLPEEVYMSERTFERKFKKQVGLNPKQFARIIQFQRSLSQLSSSNFNKLTEVGLDSGFADQSHFIKTFKHYTGQTPSFYLEQMKS